MLFKKGGRVEEVCLECGEIVKFAWHCNDQLWQDITGYTYGSGTLCMRCFDRMAQDKHVDLYWSCKEDELPT